MMTRNRGQKSISKRDDLIFGCLTHKCFRCLSLQVSAKGNLLNYI